MQGLSGYTFEGDVVAGALKFHLTGAFNAPNRLSEAVTPAGAAATKIVVIGDRSFQLNPGSSSWTASPASSPSTVAADPRGAFSAIALAGSVTSEGTRYSFAVTGRAASSLIRGATQVTGFATLQTGKIVRLSYHSDTPAVSVDLVYAAFNSAPPVTPPAGG
jgi:hypothetical protein